MKQISQIRHILAHKLKVIISSLELRVKLNLQVIDSLSTLSAACTQLAPRTEEQNLSIQAQAGKSEAVISECHQAIQKLRLLEEALPHIECSTALRLYQDFSELSLLEFKHILSYESKQLG